MVFAITLHYTDMIFHNSNDNLSYSENACTWVIEQLYRYKHVARPDFPHWHVTILWQNIEHNPIIYRCLAITVSTVLFTKLKNTDYQVIAFRFWHSFVMVTSIKTQQSPYPILQPFLKVFHFPFYISSTLHSLLPLPIVFCIHDKI